MWSEANRLKARADSGVDDAVIIARAFVAARDGDYGRGEAIRRVAQESRVGATLVRSLVYPSRRPKSVCVNVFRRLAGAYYAYLARKIRELETEIARVESLGAIDGAAQGLLVEAEAVTRQIRALIPAEPQA